MMKLWKNRGFTLFELMIAVSVFLVVIVGLLALYINCISLSELSKNTTIALSGAKAVIEDIRNTPFDDVVDDYDNYTFHIVPFDDWNIDHNGSVEIDDSNPTLLEVRVTVSWRERSGRIIGEDSSPAKIVTLITRRP